MPDWPYCKVLFGVPMSKCAFLPHQIVSFIIYLFIIPSIYADILDIGLDTKYVSDIVNGNIVNTHVHYEDKVFWVMFIFLIFGTCKSAVVIYIAYRQVKPDSPLVRMSSSMNGTSNVAAVNFRQTNIEEANLQDEN